MHTQNGNIQKNLKIATWNKGPAQLKNSILNIQSVLQTNNIDILSVQELNLRTDDNKNTMQIDNYNLIHDQLITKNGISRSGIFIKKDLKYKTRLDLTNKSEAHTVITLYITNTKTINIHSWYRQWQEVDTNNKIPRTGTTNAQKTRLIETIKMFKKSSTQAETIILSDSNINTQNINSPESLKTPQDKQTNKVSKILLNNLLSDGFTIMNTKPTHKTSTIDHLISTHPLKFLNTSTVNTHLSDHLMVIGIRSAKKQIRTPRYIITRRYSDINWDEMKSQISSDQRLALVHQLNDPDQISLAISQTIIDHLDQWAPTRRIQTRANPTTLSDETKNLITARDNDWSTYCRQPTIDNKRSYNHLKNAVKRSLKTDRDNQNKRNVADATSSRDYWKHAKNIIGWKQYTGPKILINNGKLLNSPKQMADQLNVDYIVHTNLASKNTPHTTTDPMTSYQKMLAGRNLNMAFQPIGSLELSKIVDQINPSKSTSTDGISMKLIRKLKHQLLPALLHLVNTTIITSTYPQSLKISKITPLLKKDKDETKTSSYRGINLISAIAKVIDKTLMVQLIKHLDQNNLIPHHHHGGTLNHGTTTALATIIDNWSIKMEQGIEAAAVMMDQSLAFDLVFHPILIKKLKSIGLDQHSVQLMQTYLNDRQQTVHLEGYTSPPSTQGQSQLYRGHPCPPYFS